MPRTRLVRVAEASAPEDFNICDIASGSYGSKCAVPSSKNLPKVFANCRKFGRPPKTLAQICNLPYRRLEVGRVAPWQRAADYKSAIRQAASVRYFVAAPTRQARSGIRVSSFSAKPTERA